MPASAAPTPRDAEQTASGLTVAEFLSPSYVRAEWRSLMTRLWFRARVSRAQATTVGAAALAAFSQELGRETSTLTGVVQPGQVSDANDLEPSVWHQRTGAAADVARTHIARAIRRTLMAALLDRSVGDEELREQLRALILGDAILRRRHRDAAGATVVAASARSAVGPKTTIRVRVV